MARQVDHADVADEYAEVRAKVKEVCWREFHEVRRIAARSAS